ncbi:hypothetical protein [Sphingobacterium mizutaii]|uniref:hypothetical protein n=1 Tax=Sphingobacterium mizutaii TaxID=1010 RepID=UPI001627C3B2|nr:hypothetical protein [Sphingobacterium mizutaii]
MFTLTPFKQEILPEEDHHDPNSNKALSVGKDKKIHFSHMGVTDAQINDLFSIFLNY